MKYIISGSQSFFGLQGTDNLSSVTFDQNIKLYTVFHIFTYYAIETNLHLT